VDQSTKISIALTGVPAQKSALAGLGEQISDRYSNVFFYNGTFFYAALPNFGALLWQTV
jgi:hypothetical protein